MSWSFSRWTAARRAAIINFHQTPNSHSQKSRFAHVVFQRFCWPWRRRLPYNGMCVTIVGSILSTSLLCHSDFPCQLKNWLRVQACCSQALLFWSTGSLRNLLSFVVPNLSLRIVGVFWMFFSSLQVATWTQLFLLLFALVPSTSLWSSLTSWNSLCSKWNWNGWYWTTEEYCSTHHAWSFLRSSVCESVYGLNVTNLDLGGPNLSCQAKTNPKQLLQPRPLRIILITALLSSVTYNKALEPNFVVFGGVWSMFCWNDVSVLDWDRDRVMPIWLHSRQRVCPWLSLGSINSVR